MAILDASLEQAWIAAFDQHEAADRRFKAAGVTGNRRLIAYLRDDVNRTALALSAALRALNEAG